MARVTGKVYEPEVESLLLSVTWTVNVEVTADVGGVPFNTPVVAFIASQLGCPLANHV
jgi:hypothetical protein